MEKPGIESIESKIARLLEGHGVSDYIFAFRDPDSLCDIFQVAGSMFWRMGIAVDMLDEAKDRRRVARARGEDD